MLANLFFAAARLEDRPTGQVTKLTSGDDLDDDFTMEDAHTGDAEQPADEKIPSLVPESNEKAKKKQGPKVVNFVGWWNPYFGLKSAPLSVCASIVGKNRVFLHEPDNIFIFLPKNQMVIFKFHFTLETVA